MLVLLALGAMVAPAMAATPQDNDIHITRIVVEPSGPDLNFTVYYESSLFTRVFSLIFGARVLQPPIEHMFSNFSNVSIVGIDANNNVAKVTVKNIARLSSDGWYAYGGSTAFASKVDVIEVHNSDGRVVTLNDTDLLPVISNRLPN